MRTISSSSRQYLEIFSTPTRHSCYFYSSKQPCEQRIYANITKVIVVPEVIENTVVELWLRGFTHDAIAEIIEISEGQVSNILEEFRQLQPIHKWVLELENECKCKDMIIDKVKAKLKKRMMKKKNRLREFSDNTGKG